MFFNNIYFTIHINYTFKTYNVNVVQLVEHWVSSAKVTGSSPHILMRKKGMYISIRPNACKMYCIYKFNGNGCSYNLHPHQQWDNMFDTTQLKFKIEVLLCSLNFS